MQIPGFLGISYLNKKKHIIVKRKKDKASELLTIHSNFALKKTDAFLCSSVMCIFCSLSPPLSLVLNLMTSAGHLQNLLNQQNL